MEREPTEHDLRAELYTAVVAINAIKNAIFELELEQKAWEDRRRHVSWQLQNLGEEDVF